MLIEAYFVGVCVAAAFCIVWWLQFRSKLGQVAVTTTYDVLSPLVTESIPDVPGIVTGTKTEAKSLSRAETRCNQVDRRAFRSLSQQLTQAGFSGEFAPWALRSIQFFVGLTLCLEVLDYRIEFPHSGLLRTCGIGVTILMILIVPPFVLNLITRARQHRLLNSSPRALDLLLLRLQQGESLEVAVQFVLREYGCWCPDLKVELELFLEARLKKTDRDAALLQMASRIGLPVFQVMLTAMAHADRQGLNLCPPIEDAARSMRAAHAEDVIERAHAVVNRLSAILILGTFPTLFIVLLGPAVLAIRDKLF